jgi:hypothetical protein
MLNKRWIYFLAMILVLVSLACSLVTQTLGPSTPAVESSPVGPEATAPQVEATQAEATAPEVVATTGPLPPEAVYPPQFAQYKLPAVSLPAQFSGGYSLPVDLSQVKAMQAITLSDAQRALLAQNGFVVAEPVPGQYNEFYQVYESIRYVTEQPVFATTDSVFHVYHLIFDKMLRDLERDSFIATLEEMTRAMNSASLEQYQELKGTDLEEPALRNLAYFVVAGQLLGLPDPVPTEVADLVTAELSFIESQSGPQISPIWDRDDLPEDKRLIEDYSQYIPRGHYTRSEALERYFKSMMWYGRMTFRLRDDFETQRALLVTRALRNASTPEGREVLDLWKNIYEPTVFIVGKADDLSYFEYGALSDQVFGQEPSLTAFADPGMLAIFQEAAKQLPPPQVNSMWVWIWEDKTEATQGFRVMGQRFTLDAYVFGQMIWRNVGTLNDPRGLPKGLDFMAAMGSDEALSLLQEMGEDQYDNFDSQMTKVRQEIAGLEQDSWTQNLYWNWLYALQPVIEPKDGRYPAFMQTQAWTRKDLQTALGSWTELKHDTILYAKQVMAEMGGGGPEEPPHGYVEPNPEAYARLRALAEMTRSGLMERGLLSDLTSGNLANLIDMLAFMQDVSERELKGETLTDEEYWRIQYFGGQLEALTLAASDCEEGDIGMCRDLSDKKAALIADVATGLAPDGAVVALEEAIGQPVPIYVVLPDAPLRMGVGAVFSYYEFPVPVAERLNDEQWQEMVAAGTTPAQPDWVQLFVAP